MATFRIHKKYGEIPLSTFPSMSTWKWLFSRRTGLGLKYAGPLNCINFRKDEAMKTLKEKVEWRYYGGKHCESLFTKFYQGYILPEKFGVDKRKAHLSSLILNKEISREEALQKLTLPLYDPKELETDKEYVLKKLGFSNTEFTDLMNSSMVPHREYASMLTNQLRNITFQRRIDFIKAQMD